MVDLDEMLGIMCDMEVNPILHTIVYTNSDKFSLDGKIEKVVKDKDEYRIKIRDFNLKKFKEIIEDNYAVEFIEGKEIMTVNLDHDNFENILIVEKNGTLRFKYDYKPIEMITTYLENIEEWE